MITGITRLRNILLIAFFIAVVNLIVNVFGVQVRDSNYLTMAIISAVISFVMFFLLLFFEYFIFQKYFKRLPFLLLFISRFFVFLLIIVSLNLLAMDISTKFGIDFGELDKKTITITSVFISALVIFIATLMIMINDLIGKGVLFKVVSGAYHKPKIEETVFMFIDLTASTSIAEKIGDIKFHSLINDFIYDMGAAANATKGFIYKYVGDEVIITWNKKNGFLKNNCIECFFKALQIIQENETKYLHRYGLVPKFKTALHMGLASLGEVGNTRKEIAYLGDTINTTARILEEASHQGVDILVSETVQSVLTNQNAAYTFESTGKMVLRGKEHELELFHIARQ